MSKQFLKIFTYWQKARQVKFRFFYIKQAEFYLSKVILNIITNLLKDICKDLSDMIREIKEHNINSEEEMKISLTSIINQQIK